MFATKDAQGKAVRDVEQYKSERNALMKRKVCKTVFKYFTTYHLTGSAERRTQNYGRLNQQSKGADCPIAGKNQEDHSYHVDYSR